MTTELSPADHAVLHILRQVQSNPRLAYYIGPYTQSLELLCDAYTTRTGQNIEAFKADLFPKIKCVPPLQECRCPKCGFNGSPREFDAEMEE